MPAKAKLTTRSTSTTTVTSDNLAKGTELSFNEADSNFINLRDQSFAISDGATTTDIEAGETITFSGASVSGNTVTITGGGGDLGNLQVNGTTLSPVTTNDNLILTANGTGKIQLDNHYWPNVDGTNQQVLITNGSGVLSWKSISAGVDIVLSDFAFGVCVDSSGYATNKTANDTTILTSAAVQDAIERNKTNTTSQTSFNPTIVSVSRDASGMVRFVLNTNITVSSIANFSAGQTITFFVQQDATGSRTITWTDTIKWLGGSSTLSTGANKIDKIVLTNNGYNIFGELTKDYY